jgi:hypothetical protein
VLWEMRDSHAECAGFGYCSGQTVGGLHGCPMCHDNLDSRWDAGLNKTLYGRHRRSLPLTHPMWADRDHWFGRIEGESEMDWPTGDDWLNRWAEVERGDIIPKLSGLKRLSIWNELPYWKVRTTRGLLVIQWPELSSVATGLTQSSSSFTKLL